MNGHSKSWDEHARRSAGSSVVFGRSTAGNRSELRPRADLLQDTLRLLLRKQDQSGSMYKTGLTASYRVTEQLATG